MIRILVLFLVLLSPPVMAETLVAARTIAARSIIGPDDLVLRDVAAVGGVTDPLALIGQEARVALYAGRPIRPGDVGPPAIIDRNQIIPLVYLRAGLLISTEGRALDRAAPGDLIRVMNIASRSTVTARVGPDGAAYVSQ